ncbi:YheC/YheD family protein [Cohnella cellulosilytica]|uniref:YheC/YheD family protein n=1 Tax=Cohnella cellulosilytica TaxID=986710 RepID=A0ABW2F7P1_9BACL
MPATFQASRAIIGPTPSELGILVCERGNCPPFAESRYVKRLSLLGRQMGMRVFAFSPWTWSPEDDSVKGWSWNETRRQWQAERRRLPSVVYDRAWPDSNEEKRRYRHALGAIQASRRIVCLNAHLPHKGKVYEMLARDRTLSVYLPPTAKYEGISSLASWLRKHDRSAFLKPVGGSQGKRVLALTGRQDGSVALAGRDERNRPLARSCGSEAEALRRADRWIGGRSYLMQPLLDMRTPAGEPYDLRALMQKNRRGRWTLTGIAVRVGSPSSVTANLHGGGKAVPAEAALVPQFGERRSGELLEEIAALSSSIVARLEQTFGRFAEIGLDYGIERSGKLWFLEANSKPGRAAMSSVGEEAAVAAAVLPLSYVKSILLRPPGRVIHEFDHL